MSGPNPAAPDLRYPHVRATKNLFVSISVRDDWELTEHLTINQEVAYRRIAILIYRSGDRLRDDDEILGRATKLGPSRWRKVKAQLIDLGLLCVEDGRVTSAECRKALDRVEHQIAQKSRAGKISADLRDARRNPLENNEMGSTAAPTNYELRTEDDDNNRGRAREAGEGAGAPTAPGPEARDAPAAAEPPVAEPTPVEPTPAEPPAAAKPNPAEPAAEPFVPPPKPPRMDPNVWAIVQAMTAAVIGAYGEDEGGMARAFNDPTDAYTAEALLKAAADLGLGTGEAIDAVHEHLRRKCVEFRRDNPERSPPRALKWFSDSAVGALRSLAKARDKAARGFGGANGTGTGAARGGGYRTGDGGEPTARTVVQRAWEQAVGDLARRHRFAEARQIQAEAKANGDAAANALADRLMETALGKRRAA